MVVVTDRDPFLLWVMWGFCGSGWPVRRTRLLRWFSAGRHAWKIRFEGKSNSNIRSRQIKTPTLGYRS